MCFCSHLSYVSFWPCSKFRADAFIFVVEKIFVVVEAKKCFQVHFFASLYSEIPRIWAQTKYEMGVRGLWKKGMGAKVIKSLIGYRFCRKKKSVSRRGLNGNSVAGSSIIIMINRGLFVAICFEMRYGAPQFGENTIQLLLNQLCYY